VDNGAFSGFDPVSFRRLLGRVAGSDRLVWIACPDKVADARGTLALFEEWHEEVARAGPVAFVGQDGQEDLDVPWANFACFFIGGSTRWKLSEAAADLADQAKRRGKWLHMGRCNSRRRLRHARTLGCDSVDGTSMSRWGDHHLERFARWAGDLEMPELF
jgi:hypothetical protein